MNELQMSLQDAYMLSDSDQSTLAKLISKFVANVKAGKDSRVNRPIGKCDGKYDVPDDIDFCNDEIAEMFGVGD